MNSGRDIIIRKMTENDLDRVSQIEKSCFSTPWSREAFEEMLDSDHALYVVAELDGTVVGNCGVVVAAGEGNICNVAVDERWRARGIGELLVKSLMDMATDELKAEAYTLEVRAGNKAAISLYEKLGFVCEGVRPGFYSAPKEDARIYWKR